MGANGESVTGVRVAGLRFLFLAEIEWDGRGFPVFLETSRAGVMGP